MSGPSSPPEKHPSADSLHAFGAGRLVGEEASSVGTHVNACAECRRAVDRLVSERSSGVQLDTLSQDPNTPASSAPGRGVPPELAAHPDYKILRELGRGGMGVVYLAHNALMGRDEVLKVAQQSILEDSDTGARFLQEIRTAAQLVHPNVVRAYSVLRLGDVIVFAMEYVPGDDLGKILRARGPLPVTEACWVARQAARGLEHARQKGMVHRDIKPSNLILTKEAGDAEPIVKILDFGLAKITCERSPATGLTSANKMLGTPDYIAPEQINDAATADIRADIYSLGCTLHCLLAGKPPFAGKSLYDVLHAQCATTAKSLDLVRPDVPPELAKIVSRMMEKDPAKRYRTPAEVATALAPFAGAGDSMPPSQPSTPAAPLAQIGAAKAWRAAPQGAGRRPRWILPVLVLVGLVGAGIAVVASSGILRVRTPDGVIALEHLPEGAEVLVDGSRVTLKSAGSTVEIRTVPGKHRLEIRKEGFRVFGKEVAVDLGAPLPVEVRLEPIVAAAPAKAPERKPPDTAKNTKPSPAPPVGPAIRERIIDNAGLFSAAHAKRLDARIDAFGAKHDHDIVVETFPSPSPERLKEMEGASVAEKRAIFATWALERGRERDMSGVYVLICAEPLYVYVASIKSKKPKITPTELKEIFDRVGPLFRAKNFDEGLDQLIDSLCLIAEGKSPLTSAAPPLAPAAPAAPTFESLFNGKDPSGWHFESGDPEQRSVEEGAIVAHSPGWPKRNGLLSDRTFGDFVLRFGVKCAPDAGSGLAIRASDGETLPLEGTFVRDHPMITIRPRGKLDDGLGTTHWFRSMQRDFTAPQNLAAEPDQWYKTEVTVRRDM